jgi:WD40 repeat protein
MTSQNLKLLLVYSAEDEASAKAFAAKLAEAGLETSLQSTQSKFNLAFPFRYTTAIIFCGENVPDQTTVEPLLERAITDAQNRPFAGEYLFRLLVVRRGGAELPGYLARFPVVSLESADEISPLIAALNQPEAELAPAEPPSAPSAEPVALDFTPPSLPDQSLAKLYYSIQLHKTFNFILLTVLFVLAIVAFFLLSKPQTNSPVDTKALQSRELAAKAVARIESDPELALLLAREAVDTAPTEEATLALRQILTLTTPDRIINPIPGKYTEPAFSMLNFSPDGRLVAMYTLVYEANNGMTNYKVRVEVREVATDIVVGEFEDAALYYNRSVFTADSKAIVLRDTNRVRIIEIATKKELFNRSKSGNNEYIGAVEVSPTTKLVAIFNQKFQNNSSELEVWDIATNEIIFKRQIPYNNVNVTSYPVMNLTDNHLALVDDKTLLLYDTNNFEVVAKGQMDCTALSLAINKPVTKIVTGCDTGLVQIWTWASGDKLINNKGYNDSYVHSGWVTNVMFGEDNTAIFSASNDRRVHKWQPTGIRIYADGFLAHSYPPKNNLVTYQPNTVKIWNDQGIGVPYQVQFQFSTNFVNITVSPDGKTVATVNAKRQIQLWDAEKLAKPTTKLERLLNAGSKLSPNGKWVASPNGLSIQVHDAETGKQTVLMQGHTNTVNTIDFSPDSQMLVSGSPDGTARLWEVFGGRLMGTLGEYEGEVSQVRFSPNGKISAIAEKSGTIHFWNPDTRAKIGELKGHSLPPRVLEFSPDGKYLASVAEKEVYLWDTKTFRRVHILEGTAGQTKSFSFSADAKLAISGDFEGKAFIWEVETGKRLRLLGGHSKTITNAVFNPQATLALTVSEDGSAMVWEVATGQRRHTLRGSTNILRNARFVGDGQLIAGIGTEVRFWSAKDGKLLNSFTLNQNAFSSYAANSTEIGVSGNRILITNPSGDGYVYNCAYCGNLNDLREVANLRLTRDFTAEERALYLGERG